MAKYFFVFMLAFLGGANAKLNAPKMLMSTGGQAFTLITAGTFDERGEVNAINIGYQIYTNQNRLSGTAWKRHVYGAGMAAGALIHGASLMTTIMK